MINDYILEMGGDLALDIIEEAYRGKSKELLELEKMIGENRKKYYGTFKVGGGYYSDKDFIKIGDKIADIFGFKVCDFNLVNDPAVNAFTVPCGYSMSALSDPQILDLKGDKPLKYKNKSMSIFIRCTSGLWVNDLFTDEEITGVIVHEIGHNFQQNLNSGIRMYMCAMYYLRMFQLITMLINPATAPTAIVNFIMGDSEYRGKANKMIRDNNLDWIVSAGGNVMGFVRLIIYTVAEIFGRVTLGIPAGLLSISNIILSGIQNPAAVVVSLVTSSVGKSQENISDEFAADHGYGPAVISFLSKLSVCPEADPTLVGQVCKKLPVLDCVCTLCALPSMMVAQLFTDHPVTGKRASNIVTELEKDLERTDISPKMKKEIKQQIKDVKEVIEVYSKVDKPLHGTALRRKLLGWQANFDRDPKGFIQKAFSSYNLIEFADMEDNEFLDSVGEQLYFDLI